MGAVPKSVASAVPSAVKPSGSVAVNEKAQRQPYTPMTGKSSVPFVPRTQEPGAPEAPWQPSYGTAGKAGRTITGGSAGAPSVPVDGFLFKRGPVDAHYTVPSAANPYAKVNNPPAIGFLTIVKAYANHVFNGKQDVDGAGWQQSSPQQRTSYMRVTPPPRGPGYAPETYEPRQLPQRANTYKYGPVTGTDGPSASILNSSSYGAGQTAGGIGGNQYATAGPPPDTVPVASPPAGGMPVWG